MLGTAPGSGGGVIGVVNVAGGTVGGAVVDDVEVWEHPLNAIKGTTNQAIWRSFMGVLSASLNVMVNLTRIYTSTGDDGQTRLADNSNVPKTDPRIAFMGAIDEANSAIGVALTLTIDAEVTGVLRTVQNDLFNIGADVATPRDAGSEPPSHDDAVARLESWCDHFNAALSPLRSFLLPGGCPRSAQFHVARAVVRRAELAGWVANAVHPDINPSALRYLNRLSDLLFILARQANARAGIPEPLWQP